MSAIQVVLVTIIAFLQAFDSFGTQVVAANHIIWGALTGLLLGDFQTGLYIGASCQLMSLGVAAIGGASVPNYGIAAIIGTALSIATGQPLEVGITIGTAVAMLYVQFDVIAKILNGFIARKEESLCEQGKFKAMSTVILISPVLIGLCGAIPTFVACALGVDAVNFILESMPAWFTTGLSIAGAALPVIGMGMLLNYMPASKYFGCIMVGFMLATFAGLGIIPVAMVGGAWAFEKYKSAANKEMVVAGGLEDE